MRTLLAPRRPARAAIALLLAGLLLSSGGSARADPENPLADIGRIGRQLLRFEKPGALFAYLRQHHPDFFRAADAAGLADLLDGRRSAADFEAELASRLNALSGEEKTRAENAAAAFRGLIAQTPPTGTVAAGALSAEAMRRMSLGEVVDATRAPLFDAANHWIATTWDAANHGSVGVRFVPGELAWFNPHVSIPELGIRAGVPLDDAQKDAIVRLLSVRSVHDGSEDARAAFPAHVGRAINPNANVLTIISDRGEVIGELVIKGSGPNAADSTRDGRLERSEAFMDAEVSRNLARNGVRNYDTLAVIIPEGSADKALLIRAPRSIMRHLDLDKLSDAELRRTMERHLRDVAIREGLESLSLADWARDFLPRVTGENAGRLAGLGVQHGSLSTRDNHGVGETVDWGWVSLGPADDSQKESFWTQVEKSIERVNALLPDGEKVDVAAARQAFEEAFGRGRTAGEQGGFRFRESAVREVGESDLRTLVRRHGDANSFSMSRDQAMDLLRSNQMLEEDRPVADLAGMNLPELIAFARRNGIAIPTSLDKAEVVSAISRRPLAEVRNLIGSSTGGQPRTVRGPSRGVLDMLDDTTRDRVRSRTTRGRTRGR